MRKILFAIGLLLLALPVGAIQPVGAQGTDPVSVWRAYEAAFNRADADGVANTFAEDGVFVDTHPSPGLPGVWIGRGQIQELYKELLHPGDRQSSSGFLLGSAGNNGQLTVNYVRQWAVPGVDLPPGLPQPVEIKAYIVVQNGKIEAMTWVNTPEWLVAGGVQGKDPGTQVPAPLATWQSFLAAANKGDSEAMANLFADNGALIDTHPSPGLSGVWIGIEQIRALFKESVHPGDRWESSGYLVGAGDNDEQMTIETVRDWLAPGPDLPDGLQLPVESTFHLIVHNGHIAALTMDNKPGWLARAGALGQSLDEPLGMPTTGLADPTVPSGAAICLALLLVVSGSLIRRSTRRQRGRDV